VGFDGFGLYLSSELPVEVEVYLPAGARKFQFFWNRSTTSLESDWSMTFSLPRRNGKRLGNLSLYRKDLSSPLWMDLDVFTATGFSNAVGAVVEKLQDSWFAKTRKEQKQTPEFEKVSPVVA
jgi:hypothetical protein